jgi:fructose/tagatose bisphosphate aldolase
VEENRRGHFGSSHRHLTRRLQVQKRSKTRHRKTQSHQPKSSDSLVLHGASSVPQWLIENADKYGAQLSKQKASLKRNQKSISLGIAKVNVDTDLRLAFTGSVREVLTNSPKEFDPRKILGPARETMKQVAKSKMQLFGSAGKA